MEALLSIGISILIFGVVLFVLILVHEFGHFIVAKRMGMRVDEFGIGFPPKLKGIWRGETEYTINALPIGGFVRIFGEDPNEVGESPDKNRSFGSKSRWAQAAVLIAGVTANVLLAWVLFVAIYMIGVQSPVEEGTESANAELTIVSVLPDSPAASSGIMPQTVITGVEAGGETLSELTPEAFTQFTKEHVGVPLQIKTLVGDEEEVFSITPATGVIEGSPDQAALGIGLGLFERVSYGFFAALKEATDTTVMLLGVIVVGISTLIVDALQLDADLSGVAGPVGIVGLVGDAAQFGIVSLMWFTAVISLNLAIINLLPFPALDGGRLLFVAIEGVIRRPINPVWTARLNSVGFVLLILLMVVVTYSDIVRLAS